MANKAESKPSGRPTKLTEEMMSRSYEYIESGWKEQGVIPSIEGLAVYLKVSRSTVNLWGAQDDAFSDILDDLRAKQATELLNKGLSGDFNSTITKLILSKHDYTEKTEVHNTVTMENMSDDELKARIEALQGI